MLLFRLFFLYKGERRALLNCNFPLPHVFPPPPFPLEREPTASASRGDTLGSRIDRDVSLIMPLRFMRQAWPTTRRSRLYFSSSSALQGSPPLRLEIRLRIVGNNLTVRRTISSFRLCRQRPMPCQKEATFRLGQD